MWKSEFRTHKPQLATWKSHLENRNLQLGTRNLEIDSWKIDSWIVKFWSKFAFLMLFEIPSGHWFIFNLRVWKIKIIIEKTKAIRIVKFSCIQGPERRKRGYTTHGLNKRQIRGWLHGTGPKLDRHDLRPLLIQISLSSVVGPTQMSSDRFEVGSVRNFLYENAKFLQTNHWCDEQEKHWCWKLTRTGNVVRNICKDIVLVSSWSHVNTSENVHIGSAMNSYLSHIITS